MQNRPQRLKRRSLAGTREDRTLIGLTAAGRETLDGIRKHYQERRQFDPSTSYVVACALDALAAEIRASEHADVPRLPMSDLPVRPIAPKPPEILTPKEQREQKKREREEFEQEQAERYRRSHAPTEEEREQAEETRAGLYAKLRRFTKEEAGDGG
jgi:hypothetical protein